MKKWLVLLIMILVLRLVAGAASHVRGVHHIPGGYRYARVVPTIDIACEWWFGPDKVAFSSTGWGFDYSGNTDWKLVWDKGRGRVIVANLTAKTYLEVSMTASPKEFVDEAGLSWIPQFKIYGTVSPAGSGRPILGRACREFDAAEWQVRNDEDRFYDRRRKILASTEVDFDWRLADELFLWVSGLFNPQPDYLLSQEAIRGFVLASEEEASEGGSVVPWSYQVVDIHPQDAPGGTFDPPPGYKRVERLDIESLFNLRGIVHICPIY